MTLQSKINSEIGLLECSERVFRDARIICKVQSRSNRTEDVRVTIIPVGHPYRIRLLEQHAVFVPFDRRRRIAVDQTRQVRFFVLAGMNSIGLELDFGRI